MILCTRLKAIMVIAAILMAAVLPVSVLALQTEGSTEVNDTLAMTTDSAIVVYPQPPVSVVATDNPNDGGGAIIINWDISPDDHAEGSVVAYRLFRSEVGGTQAALATEIGDVTAGATKFIDGSVSDESEYNYFLVAITDADISGAEALTQGILSNVAGPVSSSAQWFDARRINVLVGTLLLSFFIIYWILQAKSGKKLYIRKIAGMEAVDEAVGRATEMGKKIFFVPGIQDMDNVQTIAGMTILGRVAELAAQYDTWLEVPVCRSLVLVTAKEVLKEAYTKVGRPDAYNENQVHYLTDDQFGYAAAVDGMVVREKPAAIFYMGAFFAESLILAETGNATGAIQIAGTAMPSQLPFFVASCDYTLIGEELFAASAYLSREPKLLGSLKGQDYGKGVILIAVVIGLILETFGIWDFSTLFSVIQ